MGFFFFRVFLRGIQGGGGVVFFGFFGLAFVSRERAGTSFPFFFVLFFISFVEGGFSFLFNLVFSFGGGGGWF